MGSHPSMTTNLLASSRLHHETSCRALQAPKNPRHPHTHTHTHTHTSNLRHGSSNLTQDSVGNSRASLAGAKSMTHMMGSSRKLAPAGNDLARLFPWKKDDEGIDLGYGLGSGQWAKTAKLRMKEKLARDRELAIHEHENECGDTPLESDWSVFYFGLAGMVLAILGFLWFQSTTLFPSATP
mmetsp:Transcript_48053/g.77530  ORF Transcript_48053/g.77530 Transcript_48053/m.77530 type:complete len:182 (+) Transcript_48053:415-960(+)